MWVIGIATRKRARREALPDAGLPDATWTTRQPRQRDEGTPASVDCSYSWIHTIGMSVVRRTISLPASLASRLEREAKRRGLSFSAIVAELATRSPEPLPYAGLVRDDKDLSLRVTEALRRARG